MDELIPVLDITPQMVFDAAWQAFVVERKPPALADGGCVYLDKDGGKCAVGLCIPDGHPAQRWIGGVLTLIGRYDCTQRTKDSRIKLALMQRYLHDHLASPEGGWDPQVKSMEAIYRAFALNHKLTIPGEENNESN